MSCCNGCSLSVKYRKSFLKQISNFSTYSNLTLVLLWVVMIVLVYYIKTQSTENQVFNPYHILGLEPGAPDSEIKKAYWKLSVLYHPDKNPDLEANKYFVEKIVKTYQALTDPVSRENYETYGHPDGRQVGKIYRQIFHAPDVVHLLLLCEAFSGSQVENELRSKGHMFGSPKINVSTVIYDRLKRHQCHQDTETCGTAACRKDSHYKGSKSIDKMQWYIIMVLHEEIQHEEGSTHIKTYLLFYLLIIMVLDCITIVFFFSSFCLSFIYIYIYIFFFM